MPYWVEAESAQRLVTSSVCGKGGGPPWGKKCSPKEGKQRGVEQMHQPLGQMCHLQTQGRPSHRSISCRREQDKSLSEDEEVSCCKMRSWKERE